MKQQFKIINNFPDPHDFAATKEEWLSSHGPVNAIIDCKARNIFYSRHWTMLSMKFCFNGSEFYNSWNKARYAVNDNCYLVLNNGTEYESYIRSMEDVESVTVNFSDSFVLASQAALFFEPSVIEEDPAPTYLKKGGMDFFEQLNPLCPSIQHVLASLRAQANLSCPNVCELEELYFLMFSSLVEAHKKNISDAGNIKLFKHSTRIEIYKRLMLARDYIESCYSESIDLDELSRLTLMNPYYFLRVFKSYFGITPHQYLTKKRIEMSKHLLARGISVKDTCHQVGYSDLSSFGKLFSRLVGSPPSKFKVDV